MDSSPDQDPGHTVVRRAVIPPAVALPAVPLPAVAPPAVPQPAIAPPAVAGGFCTTCGQSLPTAAKFCTTCGSPAGGTNAPAAESIRDLAPYPPALPSPAATSLVPTTPAPAWPAGPGMAVNLGPGRPATIGERVGTRLITMIIFAIPLVGFVIATVALFKGKEIGGLFTGLTNVDLRTGRASPGKFILKGLLEGLFFLLTFGIAPLIMVWLVKPPYNQHWFDRKVEVVVMKRP